MWQIALFWDYIEASKRTFDPIELNFVYCLAYNARDKKNIPEFFLNTLKILSIIYYLWWTFIINGWLYIMYSLLYILYNIYLFLLSSYSWLFLFVFYSKKNFCSYFTFTFLFAYLNFLLMHFNNCGWYFVFQYLLIALLPLSTDHYHCRGGW